MVKTCLVSGGARGIGRAIARRFLDRGYKVYILDIDENELNYATDTHFKDRDVASSVCNLRDVNDIRDTIEQKVAKFFNNKIDVLVNNGGIASPKWGSDKTMYDKETIDEWQAYLETNLTAPFAVSQACLPYMKDASANAPHNENNSRGESGPCIIHIGSFRAHQSDPNQEGYASTKAGLLGLMHSMAISLQPYGIRVNLVAPGRIKVGHECQEGDEKGMEFADLNEDKDVEDHPANRAGSPEDIADAVEYFVGAGFVTGQDFTVDGGATKKK